MVHGESPSVHTTRGTSVTPDYAYPKVFGGWGQVTYFLTDKLFISGWYGQMDYNMQ